MIKALLTWFHDRWWDWQFGHSQKQLDRLAEKIHAGYQEDYPDGIDLEKELWGDDDE